jgi:glucokinase
VALISKTNKFDELVLCSDIGGTHANFCIAGLINRKPTILFQAQESTTSVNDLLIPINNFLTQARDQGYDPTAASFAVAGPVANRRDYQKVVMTNTDLKLDTRDIERETGLENILMMNDFVAVSYAINLLEPQDYYVLSKGNPEPYATKAVLGAGTGLGKSILYFNDKFNAYMPIPSEGGNTDLPLLNNSELKMAKYIKTSRKLKRQLYYEDILSGNGLESLYRYLNSTKYAREPKRLSAEEISKTRTSNKCSNKTFELFVKYHARCARNFVLDTLSKGGLYLAGGITAKNPMVFDKFYLEFNDHGIYGHILKDIPIYLITNYDVGLLGAAYGAALRW